MKIFTANILGRYTFMGIAMVSILFMAQSVAFSQATVVDLGTAGNYRVLAGSAISIGTGSTVTGDIGLSPASGTFITGAGTVTGVKYSTDGAGSGTVNGSAALTTAKTDLTTAYTSASNRTGTVTIATELGSQNLTAGVYTSGDGTFGLTGTLTLTGNAAAVFIFKMSTTLTTAVSSTVTLSGGVLASNVFWQVGSSATISGAFKGIVMADQSITLNTGASLDGRALARIAAVTFQGTNSVLPVELVSFTASANMKNADLKWSTATEVNNFGFEVQRSAVSNQQSAQGWTNVGFVEGNGTTNAPKNYSYVDNAPASGTYSYRLKQIDRDGQFEYSPSVEVTIGQTAKEFALLQNYPNPFNPSTTIGYQIPAASHISLKVYDLIGNEIVQLVNETKEAGSYTAHFDASKLSSGIYFYTITAGRYSATKQFVLLK